MERLGILRRPLGKLKLITRYSVTISIKDNDFAVRLRDIIERYNIWRNYSVVLMSDNKKLRIDLINR